MRARIVTGEWKPGQPPPVDTDGEELIFSDEVAEIAGIEVVTVYWYNANAATLREAEAAGMTVRPPDAKWVLFPAPVTYIRRTKIKSDGRPKVSDSPAWRKGEVVHWAGHRRGPGGKLREVPAGSEAVRL